MFTIYTSEGTKSIQLTTRCWPQTVQQQVQTIAVVQREDSVLWVKAYGYHAAVQTQGYVTDVMRRSFVDKSKGSRDQGHDDEKTTRVLRFQCCDAAVHGHMREDYLQLRHIFIQAKQLSAQGVDGNSLVALQHAFR